MNGSPFSAFALPTIKDCGKERKRWRTKDLYIFRSLGQTSWEKRKGLCFCVAKTGGENKSRERTEGSEGLNKSLSSFFEPISSYRNASIFLNDYLQKVILNQKSRNYNATFQTRELLPVLNTRLFNSSNEINNNLVIGEKGQGFSQQINKSNFLRKLYLLLNTTSNSPFLNLEQYSKNNEPDFSNYSTFANLLNKKE